MIIETMKLQSSNRVVLSITFLILSLNLYSQNNGNYIDIICNNDSIILSPYRISPSMFDSKLYKDSVRIYNKKKIKLIYKILIKAHRQNSLEPSDKFGPRIDTMGKININNQIIYYFDRFYLYRKDDSLYLIPTKLKKIIDNIYESLNLQPPFRREYNIF